jgi:hypothetical protein
VPQTCDRADSDRNLIHASAQVEDCLQKPDEEVTMSTLGYVQALPISSAYDILLFMPPHRLLPWTSTPASLVRLERS